MEKGETAHFFHGNLVHHPIANHLQMVGFRVPRSTKLEWLGIHVAQMWTLKLQRYTLITREREQQGVPDENSKAFLASKHLGGWRYLDPKKHTKKHPNSRGFSHPN